MPHSVIINFIMSFGRLNILKWLYANFNIELHECDFAIAICHGNINIINWSYCGNILSYKYIYKYKYRTKIAEFLSKNKLKIE